MSSAKNKCRFNPDWLCDPKFSWLSEAENDVHSARCKLCLTSFSLSNMGRRSVTSHADSKKHMKLSASVASSLSLGSFFTVKEESSKTCKLVSPILTESGSPQPAEYTSTLLDIHTQSAKPRKLDTFVLREDVTKAEILFTLHAVMTHKSMRLSAKDVDLFPLLFPDSKIAEKISLQRDKQGYMILYGLSPYFKNELLQEISNCEHVTVGFDESLNKVVNKQQMDINIRFWDSVKGEVTTRYLTSVFLGHTTAQDLLNGFISCVGPFLKKLVQVSMDGPNVNFKFLRDLKSYMKDDEIEETILDLGSCGLHTLHCAFKAGISITGWNLVQFLRAVYNLFKFSPARRADYTAWSSSSLFPQKFCAVRWLENQVVAQRAIDILPYIVIYVERFVKEKRVDQSASFAVVQKYIKDPLLRAKLAFFKTVASDLEPFLREFQSDVPMAPFLHSELSSTCRNVMDRFMKTEVLEKESLTSLDVYKTENLLNVKDVKIGHATRSAIKKCRENGSSKITDLDLITFRKECQTCLQTITKKIFERSPLKFRLTKAVSCFNPSVTVESTVAAKFLELLLSILVDNNQIDGVCADRAAVEFRDLCKQPGVKELLNNYSRSEQRLDHFWIGLCNEKTKSLLKVLKLVMILSHGNSNVERGFSVNSECVVDNLKEQSLVARRMVYDTVKAAGGVRNITITKSMLHAARNARARSKEAAEQRHKEELEKGTLELRKKKANEDLKELKEKKARLLREAQKEAEIIDSKITDLSKMIL